MFSVTILGNNSALPACERHPTAQVVSLQEQLFLIDCGEGTQIQLARYKVKRGRINHIFISHLHGDHYFGLIGLITSMGLLGREQDLHVYGPAGLEEIIQLQLRVADTSLPFHLQFHVIDQEGILLDHPKYSVSCFSTQHRIPCFGFIVREKKKPRKINRDACLLHGIPAVYYERLKNGDDYERRDGSTVANDLVTFANSPALSYAYSADTIYDPSLATKVAGVTMLYHETTYLKDQEERATLRFHSTTVQAAAIAKSAGVEKLLIGHFSSKYETLDDFLSETCAEFPNTQLALEGATYFISQP